MQTPPGSVAREGVGGSGQRRMLSPAGVVSEQPSPQWDERARTRRPPAEGRRMAAQVDGVEPVTVAAGLAAEPPGQGCADLLRRDGVAAVELVVGDVVSLARQLA